MRVWKGSRQLAALLLFVAAQSLLVGLGEATALFNTDCMKNPFATGCRGISAKRSMGAAPFLTRAALMGRSLAQSTQQLGDNSINALPQNDQFGVQMAPPVPLVSIRAAQSASLRELLDAIERLAETTNRLVACGFEQQQAEARHWTATSSRAANEQAVGGTGGSSN